MTSIRRRAAVSAVLAFALTACASAPTATATREREAADTVVVYPSGRLVRNQYTVLRRLWIESWRSAFWLPTFETQDAAIANMRLEAARLGADGLVDVACLDMSRAWSKERAFVCSGNAIRLKG